jgi:hypothetical protein
VDSARTRRQDQAAIQQSPENGIKRLLAAKYLEKDARVEANRHA